MKNKLHIAILMSVLALVALEGVRPEIAIRRNKERQPRDWFVLRSIGFAIRQQRTWDLQFHKWKLHVSNATTGLLIAVGGDKAKDFVRKAGARGDCCIFGAEKTS